MNRPIAVTALASLLALSAQAAFAQTTTPTTAVVASPSTASVSMPAPAARPAVRIPGNFDAAESTQAFLDQVHVMVPALSGNG
jgi:hypothetical protein